MQMLLPVVLVLLSIGLASLVRLWPRGREFSFSQHAAVNRSATIYYAVLFLITMPLLVAYFVLWLQPEFDVATLFVVCITLAAVLQIACTFFPEKGRWVTLHRWLAGLSAVLFIPSLALLIPLAKGIAVGGIIVMLIVAGIIARDKKKRVPYALQLVYYAAFFIPVVWMTYMLQ